METDYAIIGGGVVGLSIAWGLLRRGLSATVIDGDDGDFRASRGNFGLVWVQGKGLNEPGYARWTRASAAAWAGFAEELTGLTGNGLGLRQDGGYELFFCEDDMAAMIADYEGLKAKLGGDYPFEVLDPGKLREEEPAIGPKVVGAILHREDGHANPLLLLRALADATRRAGGHVINGRWVTAVDKTDLFRLTCDDGTEIRSARLVLAAGLGAADLGPKLGFRTKVRPQRGQVMITEKLPKLINRPSPIARQVDEGGIQIGATNEEVGLDDGVTRRGLGRLAREAIDAWPDLGRAQLVRSWGALRILTPDGLPVYQESPTLPGAFLATCHSGITLAAAHALMLPDWLEGQSGAPDLPDLPDLKVFSEDRFS